MNMTTIYNDTDAALKKISIWVGNRLTDDIPVCVQPRTTNLARIGNPRDTRWYALASDKNLNPRCQVNSEGWVKVDLGAWAPPCYIWETTHDNGTPFVALPAWDREAAKTLGIEYHDWRDIMQAHAIKALATRS